MSVKSLATLTTVVVALLSHVSFAALAPLTQQQREEMASNIATGYVISIKKEVIPVGHGTNTNYTVQMIVNSIEKGKDLQLGQTATFHYWKQNTRPAGWAGDAGQYGSVLRYKFVKAYLTFDETTKKFSLLRPNGFDIVE